MTLRARRNEFGRIRTLVENDRRDTVSATGGQMSRYLVYRIIRLAIAFAILVVGIVGFMVRDVRVAALVAFFFLMGAALVLGFVLNREQGRRVSALKAANGGALPLPYPARTRNYLVTTVSILAVLGILSVITGLFLPGDESVPGLFLIVLGGSFELSAAVMAVVGWRLFQARAKADRAIAEG
jgi:hypothetical protein